MHPTHCIHKYSGTKSHSKNNYLEPYSNSSLKVLKCIIAYELLYTNICTLNADMLLYMQSIQISRPLFSFCHIAIAFLIHKMCVCVCVCDSYEKNLISSSMLRCRSCISKEPPRHKPRFIRNKNKSHNYLLYLALGMLYFKTVIGRGINTNSFFVPVEANVLKKEICLKNLSFGMHCKIFMSNRHINLRTKIHVIGKFK